MSLLTRFSCVVDRGPVFSAQALRWTHSLIELANIDPQNIVVHYTRETEPEYVAAFAPLGVRTAPVEPVSRLRPHLNKLAQLRSEFLRDADIAVLCDCDTFFVADPRPYFARDVVAAAIVDRPAPPIEIWDELLQRAGLFRQRPDIDVDSTTTIFENRNGGLYVLPGYSLAQLDPLWRKWAEWLEGQLDVLGWHAFHIDQIAFALTCLELRIEPDLLPKGLNFPTHRPPVGDDDCAPIMLHYHRHIDETGMLKPQGQPTVDRTIDFANQNLARPARVYRKRRLVLHVGLPKTGTSALQRWCNTHSDLLLQQGIRYPTPSSDTAMPKHQFVVANLQTGDLARTIAALAEGDEETTILTSEGLSNHLYDFRPIALEQIRDLFDAFHLSVFLVHRRPDDWVKSYHKQCEINPRIPEYNYGLGLDLAEFRNRSRVRRLMDTDSLAQDCAAAFGAKEVVATEYESNWLERFFDLCGYVPAETVELEHTNESIPDWVFDAVLRINRLNFSDNARIAWLGTLQRFTKSRHVGLGQHEVAANSRDLWRELVPSLADEIAMPDPRWAGYRDLVKALSGR